MQAEPAATDTIVTHRAQVFEYLKRHRAHNPIVLSYTPGIPFSARRPGLELMVEFEPGAETELNWGGLQVDLSLLLGYQVDILTEPTLQPNERSRLLPQQRPL